MEGEEGVEDLVGEEVEGEVVDGGAPSALSVFAELSDCGAVSFASVILPHPSSSSSKGDWRRSSKT